MATVVQENLLNTCLKNFLDHYKHLTKTVRDDEYADPDDDFLCAEYRELRNRGDAFLAAGTQPREAGNLNLNRKKNRYRDILPFDNTRVKLETLPGIEASDYINANFVKGVSDEQEYIASQAPLPHTVNDFWRMIWQSKVKVVIMACNEKEGKKAKCERYWPNDEETMSFGDISVKLMAEEQQCSGHFIVRRLQAKCDNVSRTVMQYHYTKWPDHGIPGDITPILDMLTSVRNYQPKAENSIIVHCSAGCGRTGTIIAIDYVWNLLKEGLIKTEISILEILTEMRQQRPSLVQTKDQYAVVYQCIIQLFQKHVSMMDKHVYENCEPRQRNFTQDASIEKLNLKDAEKPLQVTVTQNAEQSKSRIVLGSIKKSSSNNSLKQTKKSQERHDYENTQPLHLPALTHKNHDAAPHKPSIPSKPSVVGRPASKKQSQRSASVYDRPNMLSYKHQESIGQNSKSSLASPKKSPVKPAVLTKKKSQGKRPECPIPKSGQKETSYDMPCTKTAAPAQRQTRDEDNVYALASEATEGLPRRETSEYSYADISSTRKWSVQSSGENHQQLDQSVQPSSSTAEPVYCLAYDDDESQQRAPPLPKKTAAAFEEDHIYEPQDMNAEQLQLGTLPNQPEVKQPKSPSLLTKFKNATAPLRRGSNNGSDSDNQERMYRGSNVAFPNRVSKPCGPRGTPWSVKRK